MIADCSQGVLEEVVAEASWVLAGAASRTTAAAGTPLVAIVVVPLPVGSV